jgi:hypothetical protein
MQLIRNSQIISAWDYRLAYSAFIGTADRLDGAMLSVLAILPKVCGFNLGRGRRIFKGDKFRSCWPHVARIYGMLNNLV